MKNKNRFDIIIIGAGSGGLGLGLIMNHAGLRVLMVSKTSEDIGGECLNDGCIPSKAIIHIAKIVHCARQAASFGLQVNGKADIKKITDYIQARQDVIREHESKEWLEQQGITVVLGEAKFAAKNAIEVDGITYTAKKIVIATGSKPQKLKVEGVEQVKYFDNESIFSIEELPEKMLIIGGGPVSIEMGQALSRLGSKIKIVANGQFILEHDNPVVTGILQQQLEKEGIEFILDAQVSKFISNTEAFVIKKSGETISLNFDAVFVGIGRELNLGNLNLAEAGIKTKDDKIVIDKYLRTSNKSIVVCGDAAGDLKFSHAAEFHARIILNNFFSPFKKKLDNKYMSWVTFTDPELATFGLSEKQIKAGKIKYTGLEKSFAEDDRAVTDNYQYGKIILLLSNNGIFSKQKVLGGTMIAPNAGEIIQELILANSSGLSVNAIFNKIYPYPVAARINQAVITDMMIDRLTPFIKTILQKTYKIFG